MHRTAAATAALSDEQLMARVQADDDRAFEVLYDRNHDRAWRLAQLLRRQGDREDRVVEDASIAAWRERARYRPGHDTAHTWTMHRLYRRATDPDRSEPALDQPGQSATGEFPAAGEPDPHNRAAPTLRGLPDRLPEPQKEIIALALYGGLTHTQIEELLALPPGTVKRRMRLGLHKLRDDIDPPQPVSGQQ